jgi:hypothetical protein
MSDFLGQLQSLKDGGIADCKPGEVCLVCGQPAEKSLKGEPACGACFVSWSLGMVGLTMAAARGEPVGKADLRSVVMSMRKAGVTVGITPK